MNKKLPTPKEHQVLIEAYHHINLCQEFPGNETLSKILHVEPPRISYMKGELREKGYLEGKHGHEKLTTDGQLSYKFRKHSWIQNRSKHFYTNGRRGKRRPRKQI